MSGEQHGLRDRRMGEIAMTRPGAAAILRDHGLDFARHDVPLGDAAAALGLDAARLERDLHARTPPRPTVRVPVQTPALIDHIVRHYHEAHRVDLAMTRRLARKVAAVHGDDPAAPAGLSDTLAEMAHELEEHMAHEETVLFPAMAEGGSPMIDEVTALMRAQHDEHARFHAELSAHTGGFAPPAHACATWTALYQALARITADLMEHVYLENQVLFPRFEPVP